MIGQKRFKKEIPVPPVDGFSLNGEARNGSKIECLSPHSDSRHSLGNNFFFSSVSNSDFFEYALKQIKNSEVVGRLDRFKNVGSGENQSILERKHSHTPRNFYPFGTPPRDEYKPFEMFVPRSPDQPHSFAGYSKLLYSGYSKILAATRLQDTNVLGTNDHLENLFTTPSKRSEPSTGKSSTD